MEGYYYLDQNNKQRGPVLLEELASHGVTKVTMIWKKGMVNWQAAAMVPEVMATLASTHVPLLDPAENKFKMVIPEFMSPADDLNDDAIFQYESLQYELFLMVIEDDIEEYYEYIIDEGLAEQFPLTFEGFCMKVGSEEGGFITPDDWNNLKQEKINGLNAYTFAKSRILNDAYIYYKIAVVEGKNTYYQVVSWTSAKKKKRYEKLINDIIGSFTEI